MLRGSLQVSEEEFLRGIRAVAAGMSLVRIWRGPTTLSYLSPGFLLPHQPPRIHQAAVWLPKPYLPVLKLNLN